MNIDAHLSRESVDVDVAGGQLDTGRGLLGGKGHEPKPSNIQLTRHYLQNERNYYYYDRNRNYDGFSLSTITIVYSLIQEGFSDM